jgi:alpha-ketoglutarate-dependent taurine dioxygenase
MQPEVEGIDLTHWAQANRGFLKNHLLQSGGILFRNFNISSPEAFERFVLGYSDQSLEYKERSSPRTRLSKNIYTSTDYPADQSIFFHNENSYQRVWPMTIFFCCIKPSIKGGETPIVDCRKVFQRISQKVKDRFMEKGWMLVRNYGGGLALPWQSVFQTEEKANVDAYCRQNRIETEWQGEKLRTRQIRRAVVKHPETAEMVWFNHIAFFHISTLDPSIQQTLLSGLKDDDLPNNTYYGDGAPIEPGVLDEIREAYKQEATSFVWQEDDLLTLDNVLIAHGRNPYIGQRKILVALSEPFDSMTVTSQ